MGIKQDFRVYCSTNFKELNKSVLEDAEKEDDLILEGIASTTSVDEDGDYMTKSCLEDMKRQAIGLSVLNGHGRDLADVIGKIISIPESNDDTFKIRFKVLPDWRYYLLHFLDNGINLGLSIGAKAIDYEPKEDDSYGWKVNKANLYEISLVPLPANWDSFGSVKISKELDDDIIIAKCFNGACKQLVKEYSTNLDKELEDAQDDEDKYLTKKEAISMMNEEGNALYDRLLSELLDECKKMIEKHHLDENVNKNSDESQNSNDNNNSSKNKEDEEKEKSMKEKIDEKVETEKTPNVQDLEELEGTSNEEKIDENGETKEEKVEKSIEVSVSADEVSNKDVLKSIEDLKTFMSKGIDDEINEKVNAKLEEFKKSLPNVEEIKKELREEVEQELFKELTTERKPTETEQPKIEEVEEEEEEPEEVNKAMSTQDIAKMLCS